MNKVAQSVAIIVAVIVWWETVKWFARNLAVWRGKAFLCTDGVSKLRFEGEGIDAKREFVAFMNSNPEYRRIWFDL